MSAAPPTDVNAELAADQLLALLRHHGPNLTPAEAFAAALCGNCGDFENLRTLAPRLNLRALQAKLEALGRALFAAELNRDRMQLKWVQRAIAVALATDAPLAAVRAVLDRLPKVHDDARAHDPIMPRQRTVEVRDAARYARQAREFSRSSLSAASRARPAGNEAVTAEVTNDAADAEGPRPGHAVSGYGVCRPSTPDAKTATEGGC